MTKDLTRKHPHRILGLVLMGGQSRRMGRDKALLKIAGERLLDRALTRLKPQVQDLVVSANSPLSGLKIPQLPDQFADHPGPLAGIHAALSWNQLQPSPNEWIQSCAVDVPVFPLDLTSKLLSAAANSSIICPVTDRYPQPTFALWHYSLLAPLEAFLSSATSFKVMDFIRTQPHTLVSIEEPLNAPLPPFFNINTEEDLNFARQLLNPSH